MFNPWESTLQEALSESAGSDKFGPTRPLAQLIVARGVSGAREQVESGDGLAIMCCMERCAMSALVAPPWLASAFTKRVSAVVTGEAVSWDDPAAFGAPHKKYTRKNAELELNSRAIEVWFIASELLEKTPKPPIDAGFFEEIGRRLSTPVAKTAAEEAYRLAKSIVDQYDQISEEALFREIFPELGDSR